MGSIIVALLSVAQFFERMVCPKYTTVGSEGSWLEHLRVLYFDKHCHTQDLNSEYIIRNLQDHPENMMNVFSTVIG